jgi:catechol 2,3-dioxygenase-like lactoylglutathione lyase family enzyme
MTIKLGKDSIDLAIVTTNPEAMTAFYRDVLGFEYLGEMATRSSPGGLVRRLRCGASTIKLVTYASLPGRGPDEKGLRATGYRYWTITVTNLREIVDACEGAGRPIVVPIKEISPGVRIAIAVDPDGNWVEFLSTS